tara:strand:+ start:45384 stop:45785 length:402 start_codon:yes stop_codon:yes gene_type:complete
MATYKGHTKGYVWWTRKGGEQIGIATTSDLSTFTSPSEVVTVRVFVVKSADKFADGDLVPGSVSMSDTCSNIPPRFREALLFKLMETLAERRSQWEVASYYKQKYIEMVMEAKKWGNAEGDGRTIFTVAQHDM